MQPELERVLRQQILDSHDALPGAAAIRKSVCKQHTFLQS